jgi:hypothetical protein
MALRTAALLALLLCLSLAATTVTGAAASATTRVRHGALRAKRAHAVMAESESESGGEKEEEEAGQGEAAASAKAKPVEDEGASAHETMLALNNGKGSKEIHLKTTTDHVAREGLGENLPYAGIDYLGTGYDIIAGNPDGDPKTMMDPGFRKPVIQLHWSQDAEFNTRDLRDLQPVEGYAMPEYACHHTESSSHSSSQTDYESQLSMDSSVSVGGGWGPVSGSFSASAGYNSFNKEVVNKESERYTMASYCLQFKAGLKTGPKAGLKSTSYFQSKVSQLPSVVTSNKKVEAACKDSKCFDFYNVFSGVWLTAKNKELALTHKKPKGRWLLDEEYLHWVSKDGKKSKDVLTWNEEGKAVFAPFKGKKNQRWNYNPDKMEMVAESNVPADSPERTVLRIPGKKALQKEYSRNVRVTKCEKNSFTPHQEWVVDHLEKNVVDKWSDFFTEFGTHYLDEVHLGGKMITTITVTSESKEKVEETGVDMSVAIEASFGSIASAGASSSFSKNSKAKNAFASAKKDVKTYVIGGIPPPTAGNDESAFGTWAETVDQKPMPVRYTMTPFAALDCFAKKQVDYQTMLDKYSRDSLARFLKQAEANAAGGKKKKRGGGKKSVLFRGDQICSDLPDGGNKLVSKSAELVMQEDGNLVAYSKARKVLWASDTHHKGTKPYCAVFDKDGNLKVLGYGNEELWRSKTKMCKKLKPKKFVLTGDGNMEMFGKKKKKKGLKKIWQSGSKGLKRSGNFGGGQRKCRGF